MDEYVLVDDSSWDPFIDREERARLDPNIRLVASLIDIGDFDQVFRRTGVHVNEDGSLQGADLLSLFLDFLPGRKEKLDTLATITTQVQSVHGTLDLDDDAIKQLVRREESTVAIAELGWNHGTQTRVAAGTRRGNLFRKTVAPLIRVGGIRRVAVPTPMQPCLQASLKEIGLPFNRKHNNVTLDGTGVIVGIIDDGCALAHRHFLDPKAAQPTSRIQYLWDQNKKVRKNANWKKPAVPGLGFVPSGAEIDNNAINTALRNHVAGGLIDEDAVYEELEYDVALSSHGTHVMDIAVGNGTSLLGTEGVAKASDIIFVQLPSHLVEDALPALDSHILKGVQYIFRRAELLSQAQGKHLPVVINISYGGYTGPHDGSSSAPKGIDDQLRGYHDRAVVISAGNSFEADCHAMGTVEPGAGACSLQWNLSPEDPTTNPIEIWYDENSRLSVSLATPGNTHVFGTLHLGDAKVLMRNGRVMGWIENVRTGIGSANVIRILLNSTVHETPGADTEDLLPPGTKPLATAPCPSGTWTIQLLNDLSQPAPFHAWIGRDDWRRGVVSSHQQSRFAPADANPASTMVDLSTGHLSICVGAHNGDTAEICSYSAAGPTRDGRQKPDVTAPAEEDATCRGILCASSRRSQPTWFNGTSASAPVVAGMVALILQYNRDRNNPPLAPGQILALLRQGAIAGHLVGNKRQDVDPRRPQGKRQSDCLDDVIGAGKVRLMASLP